jgi:3'(2'), 5'-bisphosphate nucleotidase
MFDTPMLDEIAAIAIEAGAEILALRDTTIAAQTKPDGSPVTQADLAANDLITQRLHKSFSKIPIVSEETPADPDSGGRYFFLVDPLDGTREFLRGAREFTVNIALIDQTTPVAGVVYAPALSAIYIGASGHGARRATIEKGVPGAWQPVAATCPSHTLRAVTSRSHLTAETNAFLADYAIDRIVSVGSSLKFCLVASGEADIYPRLGPTMEWDTAAGDAILRAAGGSVLTLDREPLQYKKPDRSGANALRNPWFVAAGAFDPFDARWRRTGSGNSAN